MRARVGNGLLRKSRRHPDNNCVVPSLIRNNDKKKWIHFHSYDRTGHRAVADLLLMVEIFGAIVQYGHDVRIVVLVVIIEWIEEYAESIPFVRRSKNVTIIITLLRGVPNCLKKLIKMDQMHCFRPVFEILTSPSAPILPRPETLNAISIAQFSKFVCFFVQMAPFWLFSDGATLTLSALAIQSRIQRSTFKSTKLVWLKIPSFSFRRWWMSNFALRTPLPTCQNFQQQNEFFFSSLLRCCCRDMCESK